MGLWFCRVCGFILFFFFFVFFFKQKTAYEMRISDWSSDVCSSDLEDRAAHVPRALVHGVAKDAARRERDLAEFQEEPALLYRFARAGDQRGAGKRAPRSPAEAFLKGAPMADCPHRRLDVHLNQAQFGDTHVKYFELTATCEVRSEEH